jgi:hypothetical protein
MERAEDVCLRLVVRSSRGSGMDALHLPIRCPTHHKTILPFLLPLAPFFGALLAVAVLTLTGLRLLLLSALSSLSSLVVGSVAMLLLTDVG